MTTRTEPRPTAAHVPPTPPPPAPAGMALTELLAALEGERRTHAAAHRAGPTRQDTSTMREPTDLGEPAATLRIDLGEAMRAEHDRTAAHAAGTEDAGIIMGEMAPGHPAPKFRAVTRLDEELEALERFQCPQTLDHLRDLAYASAAAAGWHDPKPIEGVTRETSAGEKVALIHEEATELLQHVRAGSPGSRAAGTELADIIIRALDYAGRYDIPIGELVVEKMRYNRTRAPQHAMWLPI